MHLLTLSINPTFLMRSNHFKEFKMDKKQVTDLRSELLDSRFGAKSISTIAESKRFPLHEMRDDVAFHSQVIPVQKITYLVLYSLNNTSNHVLS